METMPSRFIRDGARMEKLKSNVAVEVGIAGQINDTHAAATQLLQNAVMGKRLAG